MAKTRNHTPCVSIRIHNNNPDKFLELWSTQLYQLKEQALDDLLELEHEELWGCIAALAMNECEDGKAAIGGEWVDRLLEEYQDISEGIKPIYFDASHPHHYAVKKTVDAFRDYVRAYLTEAAEMPSGELYEDDYCYDFGLFMPEYEKRDFVTFSET